MAAYSCSHVSLLKTEACFLKSLQEQVNSREKFSNLRGLFPVCCTIGVRFLNTQVK